MPMYKWRLSKYGLYHVASCRGSLEKGDLGVRTGDDCVDYRTLFLSPTFCMLIWMLP
jgi:hypothetical protein